MENNNKDRKAFFTAWLEKLQQESWQLELVISGLALFGVYNSRGLSVELQLMADNASNPMFYNFLITLFDVGWKIFFINLLVHVILRSLWIGAIGLRYVSDEIDYEALNYSERFTKYLRRRVGEYDDFIERLERICSVIFSYTFLLFLLFLSLVTFGFGITLPFVVMESFLGYEINNDNASLIGLFWVLPYLLLGLIVFIDFITLGSIKRIKDNNVSKIYMPIYRFYSTVTLTFLYRPLIYNFIDDKYTRRLFFFSIPYIILIAFGHRMFADNHIPHFPKGDNIISTGMEINEIYYDDLYRDKLSYLSTEEIKSFKILPGVRLSAYHVEQNYISFFIKYQKRFKKVLEEKYDISPIYEPGWHFALFQERGKYKIAEDTLREQIREQFKTEYDKTNTAYKSMRDSIRKKKVDENLISQAQAKKDSLKLRRSQINPERNRAISDYNKKKYQKILASVQEMINVSVDSINYNDSLQCYFSKHPNNGEKGIRCNFNVENLEKGNHLFQIERATSYNKEIDSLYTKKYTLPFIKHF